MYYLRQSHSTKKLKDKLREKKNVSCNFYISWLILPDSANIYVANISYAELEWRNVKEIPELSLINRSAMIFFFFNR